MHYHLVYDVTRAGIGEWLHIIITLAIIAFAVFASYTELRRNVVHDVPKHRRRLLILIGVLLFLTMLAYGPTCAWDLMLRLDLRVGRYTTVEGKVTQFIPEIPRGSRPESFVVNGHKYSYTDNTWVPGFHRAQRNGSPIKDGLQVRIADVHGKIARLEVAE